MSKFKVISRNLPGVTDEKYGKHHSGLSVPRGFLIQTVVTGIIQFLNVNRRSSVEVANYRIMNDSCRGRDLLLHHYIRHIVGNTQPHIVCTQRALFSGENLQEHEADRSPLSNAEIKNAWSCTRTSPYMFMELSLNNGTTLPLLLSLYVILSFKWVISVGFAPFVVSDTEYSCEVTFCSISYPISNKAFRNANSRSTLEQVVQPLSHPEKELMLTNPMAQTDCPDFPSYREIVDCFMWTASVSYENLNLHMYTVEASSHRKKSVADMKF